MVVKNERPVIVKPIPVYGNYADSPTSTFTIPDDAFGDINGDNLSYDVKLLNPHDGTVSPLPSWISFNPVTKTLTFNPAAGSSKLLYFSVTASDGVLYAMQAFTIVTKFNVINGDDNNNILNGTAKNDVITGFKGDDTIDGQKGNDVIYGNEGNDRIDGNAGDDVLIGGTGNDIIGGAFGNDTYIYNKGDGDDIIYDFGNGADTLRLGAGIGINNISTSNTDNDLIITLNDSITLSKSGSIQIWANFEQGSNSEYQIEKIIFNDDDNLWLDISNKDKFIYHVTGDNNNNYLTGSSYSDVINGLKGNDIMNGGKGDDTYIYNLEDGKDVINENGGKDTIAFGAGISLENIFFSIPTNLAQGDLGNNLRINFNDNDHDQIIIKNQFSSSYSNKIEFIQFSDGSKINLANYLSTYHFVINDDGSNRIITPRGNETFGFSYDINLTKNLNYNVVGGDGNDKINTGSGGDQISSGSGNDTINSGSGDDFIHAGAGDDVVIAGEGDDFLTGGLGADRLIGGSGRDMFLYNNASESNRIEHDVIDFKSGERDTINLHHFGYDHITYDDNGDGAEQGLSYYQSGGETFVQDKSVGLLIEITGVVDLHNGDFIF